MTVGVIDWGIGGLDVVVKLRRARMCRPILYVSDAGAEPYGLQSDDALAARIAQLVGSLSAHGCEEIVIGCNAASTVLAHPQLGTPPVPVHGVIEPGIEATLASGVRAVAILGGRRTIESGLYGRALRPHGVDVEEIVAQPLSALVERGVLRGPQLEAAVARVVAPVRTTEAVVSACTHYLAILPALRSALPHLRTVIDPAAALVERHFGPTAATGAPDRYWTTGDPAASRRAAALAFGLDAPFEPAGDQLPAL